MQLHMCVWWQFWVKELLISAALSRLCLLCCSSGGVYACVGAVDAGLDWPSDLAAAAFFCSFKFIFQPNCFLDLDHSVDHSQHKQLCWHHEGAHSGRRSSTWVLGLQLPQEYCSQVWKKQLENLWPLSAEARHNTWEFAVCAWHDGVFWVCKSFLSLLLWCSVLISELSARQT